MLVSYVLDATRSDLELIYNHQKLLAKVRIWMTKSNFIRKIYCTLSMGKPTKLLLKSKGTDNMVLIIWLTKHCLTIHTKINNTAKATVIIKTNIFLKKSGSFVKANQLQKLEMMFTGGFQMPQKLCTYIASYRCLAS